MENTSTYKYKITVFTPTYNRAYIISNLYESLKRQTCTDFEWLVVDDGSTDNTSNLFEKWVAEETKFKIRYHKKENGGKHTAINKGLELAEGFLFFVVDSDDYLTDDAIEKIVRWERELPKDKKYCGIAGNLGTAIDETPNKIFDTDFIDGTALNRYDLADGERAMVFYTDVHRNYLYPVFENERFMTEAVTWNRMANDGYMIRFFNDIIWIYEYMADGLTKAGSSVFVNNPMGYGLWLREKAKYEKVSFVKKLKMFYTYTSDMVALHSTKVISKSIGAPHWLINMFAFIRKIKHRKAIR